MIYYLLLGCIGLSVAFFAYAILSWYFQPPLEIEVRACYPTPANHYAAYLDDTLLVRIPSDQSPSAVWKALKWDLQMTHKSHKSALELLKDMGYSVRRVNNVA